MAQTMQGDELYQRRARSALPLLVRQAHAEQPITYSALAEELRMPNARNLNYVLGAIGWDLTALGDRWGTEIPPIQFLVVSKETRVPGEGIVGYPLNVPDYASRSLRAKRKLALAFWSQIFAYSRWPQVLSHFDLEDAPPAVPSSLLERVRGYRAGGEGELHLRLKKFVAAHSKVVGLAHGVDSEIEYGLPSADKIDVLFRGPATWLAVEVKARNASTVDLLRGLFQCVKYAAVLKAELAVLGRDTGVETALVLEGALPNELVPVRNTLAVHVIEHVHPV